MRHECSELWMKIMKTWIKKKNQIDKNEKLYYTGKIISLPLNISDCTMQPPLFEQKASYTPGQLGRTPFWQHVLFLIKCTKNIPNLFSSNEFLYWTPEKCRASIVVQSGFAPILYNTVTMTQTGTL